LFSAVRIGIPTKVVKSMKSDEFGKKYRHLEIFRKIKIKLPLFTAGLKNQN
jgi:hypothetical protein